MLYATVSGIPSTEGGFIEIFKLIIPQNMINGAMLLNRGISFYLLVGISGIVVLINIFIQNKKVKKDINFKSDC